VRYRSNSRSDGGPRRTQYLSEIHQKYYQLIDEQLAIPLGGGASLFKGSAAKLPQPDHYSGEEDIEKFDAWLQSILRWLKLGSFAGPDHERERITVFAMFLKDEASSWFNDNVEGVARWHKAWTFKSV
jgi:hypothetical protein